MSTLSPAPQTVTWDDALASYQEHLDTMASLLASGHAVEFPVWNPPAGLGPLPAALVGLATSLNDRAEEIMRTLTVSMAKTRMDLEALNRPTLRRMTAPSGTAMTTTMLDQKA